MMMILFCTGIRSRKLEGWKLFKDKINANDEAFV